MGRRRSGGGGENLSFPVLQIFKAPTHNSMLKMYKITEYLHSYSQDGINATALEHVSVDTQISEG